MGFHGHKGKGTGKDEVSKGGGAEAGLRGRMSKGLLKGGGRGGTSYLTGGFAPKKRFGGGGGGPTV